MAFCGNCGNALQGTEKFCAQCGAEARSSASVPAVSAPVAPPAVSVAPAPPIAAASAPWFPQGAIPVVIPAPPPQPAAQKKGRMGIVIGVLILAALGYYFYGKSQHRTPVAAAPNTQPATGNPPPSGSGVNAALVNLQTFNAHWQDQSGMLMLTTATWSNNSNTNITSATLQCRQYNSAGTDLSEYRITLNGPTNAGTSSSFSNISLGATASGMTRVDCSIVRVNPY
ncbi:MAG: hypothetical protein ACLGXA_21360 [Acidobacteriota bacterium]